MTSLLSLECSDFATLAANGQFVDKTGSICDFLDSSSQPIHLLLRPRRSGKSTMLDMFRVFFERRDPATSREHRDLFKGLAISQHSNFNNYFSRFPVIYLDLSNVGGSTMDDLRREFKRQIGRIAGRLGRMGLFKGSHDELTKLQRDFLHAVMRNELSDSDLSHALYNLTEVVQTLNPKNLPIVLVDEYDTPTSQAVQAGYFPVANEFFRKVFSGLLKGNRHIRGALLVGILRVAKASWLSGVNNLRVFPLGSSTLYKTACMFTKKETKKLYKQQAKKKKLPFTFEELETWYNGYHTTDGIQLFNPWSVGNALMESRLDLYWVASGYDEVIEARIAHMLLKSNGFRDKMAKLVNAQAVIINLDNKMSYNLVSDMSENQLWTLIYYAGYLTISIDNDDGDNDGRDGDNSDSNGDSGDSGDTDSSDTDSSDTDSSDISSSNHDSYYVHRQDRITVKIPNYELQLLYRGWLRDHLTQRLVEEHALGPSLKLFQAMLDGQMDRFSKKLRSLVSKKMPHNIFGSKEAVYQAFLYAFFAAAAMAVDIVPQWEVDVEHWGGMGRLDLVIQRHSDHRAVIIEFKRIPDKNRGYHDLQRSLLSKNANDGLDQIETLGYRAAIRDNVDTLTEYGVAFLGPYCAVVGRKLSRKGTRRWKIDSHYTAAADERKRARHYAPPA